MGKVIVGMTMSLDGFVSDRAGSVERLYADFAELRATELLQEAIRNTGTVVMGRRTYARMGCGQRGPRAQNTHERT